LPPKSDDPLADDLELFRRYHRNADPAAREELVERFMPLARSLALRYRGSEPQDDLVQVANLGLLHAIERFDPERGIPFAAYAAPTILGELRRHFRDRVFALRVPRGLQERIGLVDDAIAKLTGDLGRPPSVREIAGHVGLEQQEVLETFEAGEARRTVSLDQPAGSGPDTDDASLADRVGVEDPGFEAVEQRAALGAGLPTLSERELLVLRLRFVEDLTQSQIAERIGHSQMHVSRILRGALQRLRHAMRESPLDE
jgi:RNA polymerase sigma-B factor